jgi:hypothetical protein
MKKKNMTLFENASIINLIQEEFGIKKRKQGLVGCYRLKKYL